MEGIVHYALATRKNWSQIVSKILASEYRQVSTVRATEESLIRHSTGRATILEKTHQESERMGIRNQPVWLVVRCKQYNQQ